MLQPQEHLSPSTWHTWLGLEFGVLDPHSKIFRNSCQLLKRGKTFQSTSCDARSFQAHQVVLFRVGITPCGSRTLAPWEGNPSLNLLDSLLYLLMEANQRNFLFFRGVGAMEIVAMDMKLRGIYIARQLSFQVFQFTPK